jgi:peptidyl-prolyl cis-trans isomerase B (cyclophilin B)
MSNPIVTMTIQGKGDITIELYPDKAPNTVKNFVSLIKKGYYDGLIFHRVISGFMIQGGCPQGTGTGGPGYNIKGEFSGNGFKQNDIVHTRGVISMARSMSPDSAGSQFFIMHANSPHLDGQYAAFGEVTEGLDIVDVIAATKTGMQDRPTEPVVMEKVNVDENGWAGGEPETK